MMVEQKLKELELLVWKAIFRASAGGGGGNVATVIAKRFTFATASPFLLTPKIPPNGLVKRTAIIVQQAFSDPTATLEVGTPTSPALLLPTASVDPTTPATYDNDELFSFPLQNQAQLTIAPGASVAGFGVVLVEFVVAT